jgi:hypothetical protein
VPVAAVKRRTRPSRSSRHPRIIKALPPRQGFLEGLTFPCIPSTCSLLFPPPQWAILNLLSRSPYLALPSPKNQACAAMCVQPNALNGKAIQYIVLYCLTPPLFHRYSYLNLCPSSPAQVGTDCEIEPMRHLSEGRGIHLVNSSGCVEIDHLPLTTGHWPLLFPRSPRC